MNTTFTKETLTCWIFGMMYLAKEDVNFDAHYFTPTEQSKFSIVGGWQSGFEPSDADLFCLSKSNPGYGMCIKICLNNGECVCADFETLSLPVDRNGEVDDVGIALEWEDDPAKVAEFFMIEWERLMESYS